MLYLWFKQKHKSMSNLTKFPAQVFCNREVQTVRSIYSRTGLKLVLVLFNIMKINLITPFFTRTGRGRMDTSPQRCGAMINCLNIKILQAQDTMAPNFPISTYRNTINEFLQIYFQPKCRCQPAMMYLNALKALKTLLFSRTGLKPTILPCPAMKKINL